MDVWYQNESGGARLPNKKFILYGIGGEFQSLAGRIVIPNVTYLVDGNPSREGEKVTLYGRTYCIESKQLLKQLDPEEYWIILSCDSKNGEEIKKDIQKLYGESYFHFIHSTEYCNIYDSIEALFLQDYYMAKKRLLCDIGQFHKHIDVFKSIVRKTLKCTEEDLGSFVPMYVGSVKIVFSFEFQMKKYTFRIDSTGASEQNRKLFLVQDSISEFLGYQHILYHDEQGYGLEGYLESVPWEEEEHVKQILRDIKRVHRSDIRVDKELVLLTKFNFYSNILDATEQESDVVMSVQKKAKEIDVFYKKRNHDNCFIHGDLTIFNIRFREKAIFIDWDNCCMGNPVYDVCFLLWSTKQESAFPELDGFLTLYYGTSPTPEQYCLGFALLLYRICLQALFELRNNHLHELLELKFQEWVELKGKLTLCEDNGV